jgi:NADPH-dependent 2,4-dienoyl-CoA reductase/sulfur reductase-like enzyme
LQDQAGSLVTLNGDGTGTMTFAGGLTVNADMQVNGNIVASGDISDQNGAKNTLQHVRDVFDDHDHGNVQNGSGTTNPPNQTL